MTNPVFARDRRACGPTSRRGRWASRRSASGCSRPRRHAERDRTKLGGGLIAMYDRMFELGDPPDYEPDPSSSLAARAEAAGVAAGGARLRPARLRRRRARCSTRRSSTTPTATSTPSARCCAHPYTVPGLERRRRPRRHDLRRQLPDDAADDVGARPRPRPDAARRRRAPAVPRDGPRRSGCSTAACSPPATAPTSTSSTSTPCSPAAPSRCGTCPPAAAASCSGPTATCHTFVAGEETYVDGEPTGALPGRAIRGPQPAPA